MKHALKKLIPKPILNLRHLFFAWWGAVKYHHPSDDLIVIGITGTSGKSTTIYILRKLLESLGYRVGSLSTIDFCIGGENKLNDQKMTMLGRMQIQKYLREMVDKKCEIAIVETTSEGRVQHRHRGINYDIMALTNLYPEHIESHGGFENYRKAKLDLFSHLSKCKTKIIREKKMEKAIVVNGCSECADEFLSVDVMKKYVTARNDEELFVSMSRFDHEVRLILGKEVSSDRDGIHLIVDGVELNAPMQGLHNAGNILTAVAICEALHIDVRKLPSAFSTIQNPPGRLESISEAEAHGFHVIVDYAFEPKAMTALYESILHLNPKRIIHVLGGTGGGRDVERRFTVGAFVGEHADFCVVTDEDPYDENPMDIINDVADAVMKKGKKDGETLFRVLDRVDGIRKGIEIAKPGDIVLITGKGSEQGMCVGGGKIIPWDDRVIARDVLNR